jgi:hypothetical protein
MKDYLGNVVGSPWNEGNVDHRIYSLISPRLTCTVRGVQSSSYNLTVFKQLDYYMKTFGSSGPATLAWEFVPFSFILDWFVDLRTITDRLDNLLTGHSKSIKDVCISEKYSVVEEIDVNFTNAVYSSPQTGFTLQKSELSYYHREPVSTYETVGWSGRFGKKQVSLLGALLHQKMANLIKIK